MRQAAFQPLCIEFRPNFWTGDKSQLLSQLPNGAGTWRIVVNSETIWEVSNQPGQVLVNANAVSEVRRREKAGNSKQVQERAYDTAVCTKPREVR